MVSGFLLPKPMAREMNKYAEYSLFLLTPWVHDIATVLPIGHIWHQHGLKKWKTTLGPARGYFLLKENGVAVGTMYIDEKRVALNLRWFASESDATSVSDLLLS